MEIDKKELKDLQEYVEKHGVKLSPEYLAKDEEQPTIVKACLLYADYCRGHLDYKRPITIEPKEK